jgi:hypothetical protein
VGRQKANRTRRVRRPVPVEVSGLNSLAGTKGRCAGQQLDHRDGSMSCSLGADCPGVALPHDGWRACDLYEPCAFCDGPPVVWVHDQA